MGYFRYQLPPPATPLGRDGVPRLAGLDPVGGPVSIEAELASERRRGEDDGGRRLMRVHRLAPAEAEERRNAWLGEGGARLLETPVGVLAWERTRADTAGVPRRQRLAYAPRGRETMLVHWSVPEPPDGREEDRWDQLIAKLAAAGADGGWLA